MEQKKVFISHASADKDFVNELRRALDAQGIPCWVDNRELLPGNKLHSCIEDAITVARQMLVVLSPRTVNSTWVVKEVNKALEIEHGGLDGYRVIPLLLPGIEPTALTHWFPDEPIAVPITLDPTGITSALPRILDALGERLPDSIVPIETVTARPIVELKLAFTEPQIIDIDGKHRVKARLNISYHPADNTPPVDGGNAIFSAPIGPIEAEDLRWYLERYYIWPHGVFKERAEHTEAQATQMGPKAPLKCMHCDQ